MNPKLINYIFKNLPYKKPFHFVDEIIDVDDKKVIGSYTFKKNESFFKGHFVNNPLVPGAILLETMGQIGLVCFALSLNYPKKVCFNPILSVVESEFHQPVKPDCKVIVVSNLIYFRCNTLKCKILMKSVDDSEIAKTTAILKLVNK